MIEKRWMMSVDGGVTYTTEVFPIDASKFTFSDENNLSRGQVFFRRKLNQKMTFAGEDYKTFWRARQGRFTCTRFFLKQERKRGAGWNTFWIGSFAPSAGDFDHEGCTFRVKPQAEDRYTCLLSKEGQRFNLLSVPPVTASAVPLVAGVEFGICIQTVDLPIGCETFYDGGGNLIEGWTNPHSQVIGPFCIDDPDTFQLGIYWRERRTTECVAGAAIPPPGLGWVLLTDDCAGAGTAEWVRNSSVPYTYGDAEIGTYVDGVPTPPSGDCSWIYLGDVDPTPFCPGPYPYFLCPDNGDGVVYEDRARTVIECLTYLIEKSGCLIPRIRSDFFEWDPVGNAPNYQTGYNYVTGEVNQVDNLIMLQKSDAIDPTASNPATLGEMSFAEFMTMLKEMFQVFWDIDEDGSLRIEHIKFWTFPLGLDLVTGPYAGMDRGYAASESLNERIKRLERLTFQESNGLDFVGKDIVYDSPCAANEGDGSNENESVEEHTPGAITTDINFIIAEPDEITKSGFVMLATRYTGAVYATIIDVGALSDGLTTNAPLSTANLFDKYWTWNRKLRRGIMNEESRLFDGADPNLQQVPLELGELCYKAWNMDPKKSVRTTLGHKFLGGAYGQIRKRLWKDVDDTATLTLVYSF